MLVRMLILSILMIVGFGLTFVGGMILFIGKPSEVSMAIGFLLPGLPFGLGCLYMLLKMNKSYQLQALDKALNAPEKILLDIGAQGNQKRILLTEDALFVGEKHYPFKAVYESLEQIKLEGDIFKVNLEVYGGEYNLNRNLKIKIPPHHLEKAEIAVAKIKEIYLIKS